MSIVRPTFAAVLALTLGEPRASDDAAKIEWLIDHAAEVRTIDPNDADFSDLAPLKSAIGDARIVALGEINHLDGATFAARARVIRFLHEQLGFDVVAWEAGLRNCRRMNDALRADGPLQAAKDRMMWEGWPESALMHPLFEYARASWKTLHPLEMAGFDLERPAYREPLQDDLLDAIVARVPELGVTAAELERVRALLVRAVDTNDAHLVADDERAAQRSALRSLIGALEHRRAVLAAQPSPGEIEFAIEALRATLAFEEVLYHKPLMHRSTDQVEILQYGSVRDGEMARLVAWFADHYYRDRKLVLCAATAHLIRSSAAIDRMAAAIGSRGEQLGPMGERLAHRFGKQMYTIAFTAWGGEYGALFAPGDARRSFARTVGEAPSGSFEDLCHRSTMPYLFLDLRQGPPGSWVHQPFVASPLGFARDRARWSDAVDAFFFIDVMTPDRLLPRTATGK